MAALDGFYGNIFDSSILEYNHKSIQYTQVMTNFDSAYNVSSKRIDQVPMFIIPMSSSATFSTYSNRSSSPLFRRSKSPPSRSPLLTGTVPKFNFDLYQMDENNNEYNDYSSPSYRSISPSSSPRLIHHYPIHSPLSSPTSKSQTLSKLRQINNELCQTLAQSDLSNQLQPSSPHYHIHHYPLSQRKHRSRSTSEEYSPSTELQSPNLHKARVTYKIHAPQRHRKSSRPMSTSDIYSSHDPLIFDLYPTRDQGFVKQLRKHSDHQSPWLVDGTSLRRSSYSDTSASQSPHTTKRPYYGDKPIKSHRRSARSKEHHYVTSRNKSPSSRTRETVWYPPTKTVSRRSPKYYEPTSRPEYDISTGRRIIDGTESEPIPQRKILSNRTKIRSGDPKFKKRIANVESKVKSAWEPTTTGLTQSTIKESKPPIPRSVKKTTINTPPKSKGKSVPSEPTTPIKKVVTAPPQPPTSRSSLNDVPTKPIFESTPRNQHTANENDNSAADLSDGDFQSSEQSKKQEPPRKPPTELPKTTVLEPSKGTKSTGNDVKNQTPSPIFNNNKNDDDEDSSDTHTIQPTPPPKVPPIERKVFPPKQNTLDDDRDENDEEVAQSFDINRWLSDASKTILGPSKKDNLITPSTPPPRPPPKPIAKSPPRRKQQQPTPPIESPDHNLYKPPFGPKKKDQQPPAPPAPTTDNTDEVDDFFD